MHQCLQKNPARRYQSAAALAQDVASYGRGEPIAARSNTTLYQLRAIARRHRALLTGALATLVALAIGLVTSVHFALSARAERDTARAINDFLDRDLFAAANPRIAGGRMPTVRDAVYQARQRLHDRFTDRPLVRAGLLVTLGDTYVALGEFAAAKPMLAEAVELLRKAAGAEDARTFRARNLMAEVLDRTQDPAGYEARRQLFEDARNEAVERRAAVLGDKTSPGYPARALPATQQERCWPALFLLAGEASLPRIGRDTRPPPLRRLMGGAAPSAPLLARKVAACADALRDECGEGVNTALSASTTGGANSTSQPRQRRA